jgi:hypothetical protein
MIFFPLTTVFAKNHSSIKNTQKMSARLCGNVDWQLDTYLTQRYFAKIGVFRCNFTANDTNYDAIHERKNLFKYSEAGEVHRIKVQCIPYSHYDEGCIRVKIEESFSDAHETLPETQQPVQKVLDLWQACCDFIIYAEIKPHPNCWMKSSKDEISIRSDFIDDCTLLLVPMSNKRRVLVLPHFDRMDRMIFWKSITEFYSSKSEFHSSNTEFHSSKSEFHSSNTEFHPFTLVETLLIFINQYL